MPSKDNNSIKVLFNLEDDAWHGFSVETLWAKQIDSNKFQIDNSPFFTNAISFMDIIDGEASENKVKFLSVIERSGHSTYRIITKKNKRLQTLPDFWKPLEELGCTFEEGKFHFYIYSITVPKSTDIYRAYQMLEHGLEQGVWDFDEGFVGHKTD